MTERYNVLVLAYMISPNRGSEYSVAWNFVNEMSQVCTLTVLYGCSGDHLGDFGELEDYLKNNQIPNVRFERISPNPKTSALNYLNRHGILPYTFYLAYKSWHRQAYEVALRLVKKERFDVVHYLGPIGYREPGYLYQIDLPYVWGPIGGATGYPARLAKVLPVKSRISFFLRSVANWWQLYFSRRVRKAIKSCDVLLTATSENKRIFERAHARQSIHMPENGTRSIPKSTTRAKDTPCFPVTLAWVGRIEGAKGLRLLIDALRVCEHREFFRVEIIGEGPMRTAFERIAKQQKVGHLLSWRGQLPRTEVNSILSSASALVITSIKEGNPTTVWEAYEAGVPVISLDHCGMADTVSATSGILIPIGDYGSTVASLSAALSLIAKKPEILIELAEGAARQAARYSWRTRRQFFLEQYALAIKRRQTRASSIDAVPSVGSD